MGAGVDFAAAPLNDSTEPRGAAEEDAGMATIAVVDVSEQGAQIERDDGSRVWTSWSDLRDAASVRNEEGLRAGYASLLSTARRMASERLPIVVAHEAYSPRAGDVICWYEQVRVDAYSHSLPSQRPADASEHVYRTLDPDEVVELYAARDRSVKLAREIAEAQS
jgi:hypothetical protein